MRQTFCSIITSSYQHYAECLFDSIKKHGSASLVVLITDVEKQQLPRREDVCLSFITLSEILYTETAKKITDKYAQEFPNKLRWSMKPVLLNYLIEQKGYDQVIFVDPDIMFFSEYQFLFEKLANCSVLLSPHWRCSNPYADEANFYLNFSDGIYNGGFVGISRSGVSAIYWWAEACEYSCKKEYCKGLFNDQKYLDLLHSRFEGVEVIRHKGCNIANWNQVDCRRSINVAGEILINGKYPIVFIHFTRSTKRGILLGDDNLLLPYLREYNDCLRKFKPDAEDLAQLKKSFETKKKYPPRLKQKNKGLNKRN